MRVLILIVALLWGGASWWWYTCNIKGYCGADSVLAENKTEEGSKVPEKEVLESTPIATENNGEEVVQDDVEEVDAPENDALNVSKDERSGGTDKTEKPDSIRVESSSETAENEIENSDVVKLDSSGKKSPSEVVSSTDETGNVEDSSEAMPDINADVSSDALQEEEAVVDTVQPEEAVTEYISAYPEDGEDADVELQDVTTDDSPAVASISTAEDIAQSEDNNDLTKIRIDLVSGASGSSATESKVEKVRIYFPYNSSKQSSLSSSAGNYFDKVVATLNANESMKITLTGHTDSQGNDKRNKTLGLRRAEVVKKMLVKRGAPARRIKTSSEGEKSPIATNRSEKGRNKNRRVELEPTT